MSESKKVNVDRLRRQFLAGAGALSLYGAGVLTGKAFADAQNVYIEPKSFSGPYSYLIETDGTYVWAKDGKTGQVAYGGPSNAGGVSGTNASAIIQSAINALPNGGVIFLKDISVPSNVVVPANVSLVSFKDGNGNIPLRLLDANAPGGGRTASPQVARELNAKYINCSFMKLTLSPTITYIHDLCYDPVRDVVWGVTRADSAINYIFKIDQSGNVSSKSLSSTPGEYKMMRIIYVDGYLWVAVISSPSKILKVNPADMSVKEYTLSENAATSLCYTGTYFYITHTTSPGKITKFNPATGKYSTITLSGVNYLYWSVFDGTYVWCAGNPGEYHTGIVLVKLNPADDSYTTFNLGSDLKDPHEIEYDGNYIWVGGAGGTSGVVRFNPKDNSYIFLKSALVGHLVAFDGKYIWSFSDNSYLSRINPENLAVENVYVDPDITYSHGLAFDGRNIWVGSWQSSCYVIRFPAYHESIGGNVILRFDGNQQALNYGTLMFVNTLGLSATEDVTQVPIVGHFRLIGIAATVLSNTLDSTMVFRVRKNGVDAGSYIVFNAGETGTKTLFMGATYPPIYFTTGDLLSVRTRAGGTTGSATIGKVTVLLYG